MLIMDAKKLRWFGIDMRARWRRRVAVALTYAVFGVTVWAHPRGSGEVLWLLWLLGVSQVFAFTMGKELGVAAQWAMACALPAVGVWVRWGHPRPMDPVSDDIWAAAWVFSYSVLAWGKLVDGVLKKGALARRLSGRTKKLEGLDDFAVHFYGEGFALLTEAQQVEVGRMHRASPMGEWVKAGSGRFPVVEDERLQAEDDALRARVLRWMTWILVASVVVWSYVGLSYRQVRVELVLAWAWTMLVLAFTLRQALVLWEEAGSGEVSEMELVEREA